MVSLCDVIESIWIDSEVRTRRSPRIGARRRSITHVLRFVCGWLTDWECLIEMHAHVLPDSIVLPWQLVTSLPLPQPHSIGKDRAECRMTAKWIRSDADTMFWWCEMLVYAKTSLSASAWTNNFGTNSQKQNAKQSNNKQAQRFASDLDRKHKHSHTEWRWMQREQ